MSAGGPNRLALHAVHEAHGAQFATHAGWLLPETYGDAGGEYERLRSRAAACDRSERTRLMVSGTDAALALGAVFGPAAAELEEGRAARVAALDGAGRIADLCLVARTGGIAWAVMGEPARGTVTAGLLNPARGPGHDVRVEDRTATTCLIAIAGPAAAETVAKAVHEALPARLPALHALPFEFHGYRALAVRASDLGEDGFELMTAPPVAEHLLALLAEAGAPPAGFRAREIARIETGVPAFTPDLETGLTPAETGLAAALGRPDEACARTLAPLLFEGRATPPAGTPALADGEVAGELRSCARSFALDAAAGLAILNREHARPGTRLSVGGEPALVARSPLYRRRNR